jgi:hypothetical protein
MAENRRCAGCYSRKVTTKLDDNVEKLGPIKARRYCILISLAISQGFFCSDIDKASCR